jgi:hypothetical protein
LIINIENILTSTVANNIVKNARSIYKEGTWLHDSEGRYLLFRGVNFASRSKLPPYLPISPLQMKNIDESILKEEIELVKPELDLLNKLGFNIIRLLISWKAIEPEPNPNLNELTTAGRKYLTLVNQIIDALYSRDLFILLDFHQDIAHEVFGGDGFPDWALAIDEEHKRPKASNLRDRKWQTAYMLNKLVKHTLSSFWKNDLTNTEFGLRNFPVRTHLEKTIGQTVNFFRSLNNGSGHPAILGIEPFNEPHPAGIAAEQFEETFLYQYYQNVESEIRKFDDKIFLFLEPRVDWTMSFQGGSEKKSKIGSSPFNIRRSLHLNFVRDVMIEGNIDTQAGQQLVSYLPSDNMSLDKIGQRGVFSFHYYDPIAITQSFLKIPDNMYRYVHQWGDIFSQLVKAAEKRQLVPFLTEFGGVQDAELIRDYIDLHYKQIETFLLNSTYWNYDLYNTKDGKDNWNLENFSLLGPGRSPRNINVMARPYPLCSSAKPILLFFDTKSSYATLILEGSVLDAPTIMYIPYDFHYSPEFRVWATSKEIEWDRQNQLLYWYPAKAQTLNQIIIAKERNNDVDIQRLPKKARDLVENNKISFVNVFS